jgi:hypothetical protein
MLTDADTKRPCTQLIVLELVLGTISQAASAATRVHQRQILNNPIPAIEVEDDFLSSVPQVNATTRTKSPSELV